MVLNLPVRSFCSRAISSCWFWAGSCKFSVLSTFCFLSSVFFWLPFSFATFFLQMMIPPNTCTMQSPPRAVSPNGLFKSGKSQRRQSDGRFKNFGTPPRCTRSVSLRCGLCLLLGHGRYDLVICICDLSAHVDGHDSKPRREDGGSNPKGGDQRLQSTSIEKI